MTMPPKLPPVELESAGRATPDWGTTSGVNGIPYPSSPEEVILAVESSLAITKIFDKAELGPATAALGLLVKEVEATFWEAVTEGVTT